MKAVKSSSRAISIRIYNDTYSRLNFSLYRLAGFIRRVLKDEHIKIANLNIFFVTDHLMRDLNKKFLNRDRSTDVLAFDLRLPNSRKDLLMGDCMVNVDAARLMSGELGVTIREEACRYAVHGVLHLLGYDDHAPLQKKRMWKKQEKILKNVFSSLSL